MDPIVTFELGDTVMQFLAPDSGLLESHVHGNRGIC
jgi:hypothetical protein